MPLSSDDKSKTGWGGASFHHANPQRSVHTTTGTFLVPASADRLPPVPDQHLTTVERAICILADMLDDRDHQICMGEGASSSSRRDQDAETLRLLANGALRRLLPPDPRKIVGDFRVVTRHHAECRGITLHDALYASLAHHRHCGVITVADFVVVPRRDLGDSWWVYDSVADSLDDAHDSVGRNSEQEAIRRSRWWAVVARVAA